MMLPYPRAFMCGTTAFTTFHVPLRLTSIMRFISAVVVSDLSAEMLSALASGGSIVASGILLEKQAQVEVRLQAAGAVIDRVVTDGDWVTLVARKTA